MHLFFALDTCIINIYNEIEVITPPLYFMLEDTHMSHMF